MAMLGVCKTGQAPPNRKQPITMASKVVAPIISLPAPLLKKESFRPSTLLILANALDSLGDN